MDVTCHLPLITLQLSPHLRLPLSLPSPPREEEEEETASVEAGAHEQPGARPGAPPPHDLFFSSDLFVGLRPLPEYWHCQEAIGANQEEPRGDFLSVRRGCASGAAAMRRRRVTEELQMRLSACATSCHLTGAETFHLDL